MKCIPNSSRLDDVFLMPCMVLFFCSFRDLLKNIRRHFPTILRILSTWNRMLHARILFKTARSTDSVCMKALTQEIRKGRKRGWRKRGSKNWLMMTDDDWWWLFVTDDESSLISDDESCVIFRLAKACNLDLQVYTQLCWNTHAFVYASTHLSKYTYMHIYRRPTLSGIVGRWPTRCGCNHSATQSWTIAWRRTAPIPEP